MDNISSFLEICHLLHSMQYVSGPGGNISLKLDDRIVITPTGRPLGFLKEEDLVWINPDGSYENGKPSKEVFMHLAAYAARPDVKAVVHVHSLYAIAVSCLRGLNKADAMPQFTPGYAMRVGKLPVIDYLAPGSPELAKQVAAVLKERNSVLLQNHGLVTCGGDLETAYDLVEEIEENAHLFFVLDGRGDPVPTVNAD